MPDLIRIGIFGALLSRTEGHSRGQGSLIAVAIAILLALILISGGLSGLNTMNSNRSVVTKQTLQTYYVAQAGVQEALASRMLPRTNALNFVTAQAPYFNQSGLVYQDPINRQGLLGEYRYFIVGGEGARQSNGSYYPISDRTPDGIPRLLATQTIPDASPFLVISKGTVCKSAAQKSVVALNRLIPGSNPQCQTGYVRDELTLVARAHLNRETTGTTPLMDRADQIRVFKDSSRVILPDGASVPGYASWLGAGSTIDFEQAWANGGVQLNRVVFYNFADNTLYADVPISGASTTVATTIPSKAVIRLYFNDGLDFRSISPTFNRQLTDCAGTGAANCNIRVMQNTTVTGTGGTAYGGNTILPLLPQGSQVILLPPLTGQIAGGGVQHAVRVNATRLRSFNGRSGTVDYTINFVTQ